MQIPVELRRRPPEQTLVWAAGHFGPRARVTRVRRLRNAWAAAMHAIDVDDGETTHQLALRRWARPDLPPDDGVVENEAAALQLIASAEGLPVPRLVGADAQGEHADVPAVLMTRLGGRDVLARPHDLDAYLDALVAALRGVHAVPVPPGSLEEFDPWIDEVTAPPSWSRRQDVWKRAIEVANEPVPAHERVLVHRDYWPGNVLWRRGKLSGLVDWTHACRGPAAADVAHCRGNLALLFDHDVADEFARRYGSVDDLAWHDIADTVSMGQEGRPPEDWRYRDAGRPDLTTEKIIAVHDEILADALSRIG